MSLVPFFSRIQAHAATTTLFVLLATGCVSSNSPAAPVSDVQLHPTATVTAATPATPPFFLVQGHGGAHLDILGTIHLGPTDGWTFAPPIGRALAKADSFMLEIDLRALDSNWAGDVLASLAILPVGTTLDDVVSPETSKLLDQHDSALAEIDFPRNARRHKKPWYLVTRIVSLDSQKSGFDPSQSVESAILSVAGDRPLMALETFEDQVRLLDQLSPRIQDIMLRDALERRHESTADIEALVEAWTNND